MHRRVPIVVLALTATLAAQKSDPTPAGKPGQPAASASRWFSQPSRMIEAATTGELVVGTFEFQNPNEEPIEWRDFATSCACSHVEFVVGERRYWLKAKPRELVQLVSSQDGEVERRPVPVVPIGARERGTVEVHVDLHGRPGKRTVQVDIHSTDAKEPQTRLNLEIGRAARLVVEPPAIDLGNMTPDERREFTVDVRAKGLQNFEIVAPVSMPVGLQATCEKVVEKGVASWRIHGTYGPVPGGRGSGGSLSFKTDVPGEPSFELRIDAKVARVLEITPGFVSLGRIDGAAGVTAEVRFHAGDDTNLEATDVRFEKLTTPTDKIASKVQKDGKDLVVQIVLAPNAPKGLLRGELVVELNHPTSPSHRVLFNGFVR